MAVLSGKDLLGAVRNGWIKITPFNEKNIGSCTIDLHLGNQFRVYKKKRAKILVEENAFFSKKFQNLTATKELKKNQTLSIAPGELVLGITKEKISMPSDLCGILEGRSRFARMGLLVHVSSSLVQPGVENHQVLEMMNMSPFTLQLKPGERVCQIMFLKTTSKAAYQGGFKTQKTV